MPTYEKILLKNMDTPGYTGDLAAYERAGGYQAIRKVLKEHKPEQVIEIVKKSGLRGRGGAGFPTGTKWSFIPKDPSRPKYLCVNADESEPGTFKYRQLIDRDPHQMLEGALIAAYAIGAKVAYIYVRGEFALGAQILERAIAEARARGYIGKHVFGSGVDIDVWVHRGAGAYICGEETALLESIEGKRGLPRAKPPFPAINGLYQQPTVVNNVETLANVAPILLRGPDGYRKFGTPDSPGTMIFSLNEDVNCPGVYELPFGTPLRCLIENCGGGMKDGKKIKAIIPAAPSSAYLSPDKLDTPLEPNAMRAAGSALGCGVVRLVGEGTCIVEEVLRIAEFFTAESCGQCPACRMETNTLSMLIKKVQQGQGGQPILEQFGKVLAFNKGKGFCNLIAMPGPPIESALKLFPGDFEAHLATGKCPAN